MESPPATLNVRRLNQVTLHLNLPESHMDDLLDDLNEWVLKMGGRVVIIPTTSGAAATCRY